MLGIPLGNVFQVLWLPCISERDSLAIQAARHAPALSKQGAWKVKRNHHQLFSDPFSPEGGAHYILNVV
jgi:hypothetical protein